MNKYTLRLSYTTTFNIDQCKSALNETQIDIYALRINTPQHLELTIEFMSYNITYAIHAIDEIIKHAIKDAELFIASAMLQTDPPLDY